MPLDHLQNPGESQPANGKRMPPNAGRGRPKGSSNKTTTMLKDAILKAAEDAGGGDIVRYLTSVAKEHPTAFASLLGKVLPTQVDARTEHHFLSHEEALALLDD